MTVKIEIVDTAGQENISSLHSSYITSGDGFLLVFSLTSLESLNELQNIRESIYRIKEAENRNGKVCFFFLLYFCILNFSTTDENFPLLP